MIIPRPYQEESTEAVLEALEKGIFSPIVSLPGGTGKTIIFCMLAKILGGRILVLLHLDPLFDQTREKFSIIWPESEERIGIVKADQNEVNKDIILASVQTLARKSRLAQLGKEFSLVITDEAHHATAESWLNIYEYLGLPRKTRKTLSLGVTATPFRRGKKGLLDATSLFKVFDQVVYEKGILEMIEAGYLSDIRLLEVKTSINLDKVRLFGNDFLGEDLAKVVNTPEGNKLVVEAYREAGQPKPTLGFGVNIRHAEDLAEAFRKDGKKAAAISGETPEKERNAILYLWRHGDIDVVWNCQILGEGFDEPGVRCLILDRPTQSPVFLAQTVGRGLRTFPGKEYCLIIDMVHVCRQYPLCQLSDLIGEALPPDASKSLRQVISEKREKEELRVAGSPVKLAGLEERDIFFRESRYYWKQREKDVFYLDLGSPGRVGVFLENNKWQVGFRQRGSAHIEPIKRNLTSLSWALGLGESVAVEKSEGNIGLILKRARWRGELASAEQKKLLNARRIPFDPAITKGEASDLISETATEKQRAILDQYRISYDPFIPREEASKIINQIFGH